ncbi:hypothetical protein Bca52824_037883 [Brassica carinata]|uniref:Uncharacterized protein n=1 Tax=Brassica carinata TaxID=52824 RepID=A0A8X7RLE8_BRACI|nr:hypothetical protein Bca52824_037883 [Brassica carinata]
MFLNSLGEGHQHPTYQNVPLQHHARKGSSWKHQNSNRDVMHKAPAFSGKGLPNLFPAASHFKVPWMGSKLTAMEFPGLVAVSILSRTSHLEAAMVRAGKHVIKRPTLQRERRFPGTLQPSGSREKAASARFVTVGSRNQGSLESLIISRRDSQIL